MHQSHEDILEVLLGIAHNFHVDFMEINLQLVQLVLVLLILLHVVREFLCLESILFQGFNEVHC